MTVGQMFLMFVGTVVVVSVLLHHYSTIFDEWLECVVMAIGIVFIASATTALLSVATYALYIKWNVKVW